MGHAPQLPRRPDIPVVPEYSNAHPVRLPPDRSSSTARLSAGAAGPCLAGLDRLAKIPR
jgi:hypothetical protein